MTEKCLKDMLFTIHADSRCDNSGGELMHSVAVDKWGIECPWCPEQSSKKHPDGDMNAQLMRVSLDYLGARHIEGMQTRRDMGIWSYEPVKPAIGQRWRLSGYPDARLQTLADGPKYDRFGEWWGCSDGSGIYRKEMEMGAYELVD